MITSLTGYEPDVRKIRSLTDDPDALWIREVRALALQSGDEAEGLKEIAAAISSRLNAPSVRIWSLTGTGDRLQLRAAIGLDIPFEGLQDNVPTDRSELGRVTTTGDTYVADCLQECTPTDVQEWATGERVTSFIAIPVFRKGEIWGVLGLFAEAPFTDRQREQLTAASGLIGDGVAIEAAPDHDEQSADLLSSLVPCLPAAVVTLNSQGLITHWSSTAETMFGWTRAEVLGKPLPIVPDERRHEYDYDHDDVPCLTGVQRSQTVCQRADQSRIPVRRTTAPLYDRNTRIIGRVEVFADDAQRVRTSRCLQMQATVARILAGCRGLDDAIPPLLTALGEWLECDASEFRQLDASGTILSRSGVWARTTAIRDQLTAAETRIRADGEDWTARAHRANGTMYEAALNGPGIPIIYPSQERLRIPVAGLAIPIRHDNDRFGVITCLGHALPAPDELISQTLAFVGDGLAQFLTRLKTEASLAEVEANVRQSQKMDAIGLLASGVTHDFNNILTVILAYSELGLDEIGEDHSMHELLTEIHGAGERAAAMTQQLLAVSRKQPTSVVTCDLNQVVGDMEHMLERLVGPQINLVWNSERGTANVQADVNRIQQVLLNLVVNARDAMPEGGTITVTTRVVTLNAQLSRSHDVRPGPYIELSVSDTGCGMDEVTRSRIFDPFFTTKEIGRGTGMGLSTVFGIVKQHGGFIQVKSAPNAGSTFLVYLPESRHTLVTQTIADQIESSPTGTESILIVENDDSVRTLIRRLLEVRGYTVREAADGGEALKMLSVKRPGIDLVLTNMQMPVVDGVALTREIRRLASNPKVLLMSGNAEPPADLNLDLSRQFLPKPFTSAELAKQVRLALES